MSYAGHLRILWKIIWLFVLSETKNQTSLFRGDSRYVYRPSNTAKSFLRLKRLERA